MSELKVSNEYNYRGLHIVFKPLFPREQAEFKSDFLIKGKTNVRQEFLPQLGLTLGESLRGVFIFRVFPSLCICIEKAQMSAFSFFEEQFLTNNSVTDIINNIICATNVY